MTEADDSARRGDGQSIARAVAILRALADRPGASFGQLATMTGMPRSTVQRLIGVLNHEGLVVKAFGRPGAYLGMDLARLGARVRIDLRALIRPFMEALHARFPDSLDLTILDQDRVVVVEQIASREAIQVISYVGKQVPVHCTANGKAHLSMLPVERARALIGRAPRAVTPRTVTDPQAILAGIEAARPLGLYAEIDESAEGIAAMAVPLPGLAGQDLALSLALPVPRFLRLREEIGSALLACRSDIQSAYGRGL